MLDTGLLGVVLKSRGLHMPRSKYQRPEVYLWTGKTKERFWKGEWRVYIEGRPKPKHKAATWPCSRFTKTKAQQECDRLVREETGGVEKPDGSVTVSEFWQKVFYPTRERRIAENTKLAYESSWRVYADLAIGKMELQHVTQHAVSTVLDRMADAGKSRETIQRVLVLINELFTEAVENGYVLKNPARHVTLPNCKDPEETRPMDEEEVRRLFGKTAGRARLIWRILVLTGARIGEVLALKKSDLIPVGLCIDESAFKGRAAKTKNKKTRYCPIPDSLRREIEDWAAGVDGELLFPNAAGTMYQRYSDAIQQMLKDSRTAGGISDLTFRQCRTTFATLYDGDPKDAQSMLGHSNLDLTMRVYKKPIAARQQASVEELDARLSGKIVAMKKRESA